MSVDHGLCSPIHVRRSTRRPRPRLGGFRAPWKTIPIVATILVLWCALSTNARASLTLWLGRGPYDGQVDDNGPLDLDPTVDSIRIGGSLGPPLVVEGYEVSLWARSYRRDGVQYLRLSNVQLSGSGELIYLAAVQSYDLSVEMFGYASHWSTARFVEPMQPENHALVTSSGLLFHNDIDVHWIHETSGVIDGSPGTESIVFEPEFDPENDYGYWIRKSYYNGIPRYTMITEMVFRELRTDIPNHIQFESEMTFRFAPWIPEPTSSVIWSAFGLAGLSLRRRDQF